MEEEIVEEVVLYKDKRKEERVSRTKNKIKSRKNKIFNIIGRDVKLKSNYENLSDGYFENNSICNAMLGTRTKLKTKSKHGCQVYRHHNIYGKAVQYANHDLKQIANLKYELKDNEFNDYIKGGEKV